MDARTRSGSAELGLYVSTTESAMDGCHSVLDGCDLQCFVDWGEGTKSADGCSVARRIRGRMGSGDIVSYSAALGECSFTIGKSLV